MDTLPRPLKWLTRVVRMGAMIGMVVQVAWSAILWSQADLVRWLANEMSGLPDHAVFVDARAQWLGFIGSLPQDAAWVFGLFSVWRLFGEYEKGRFYAAATQGHLRHIAWAWMLAGLLEPLQRSWLSIVLSAGMPSGERMLVVRFSPTETFSILLVGAVLLAIASVLIGASRLAERSRELELSSTAKSRFLAAASHDLRQPVVSISLLVDLLREQRLPAGAGPIVARINQSAQALNELLKGLLDLSRFEAGAVQVHRSRVPLRPLLARAIGDEAEVARRKGIVLRVRAGPYEVHSDAVLLEQILRNLVGNAVRCTQRGGVLVSARRRGSDRVLLQVWDSGPGIAPEQQARVFEEFVRLQTEGQAASGGLGLGLALVRRAADVLGTPIALRSAPQRGSCFSIEVPLIGLEPTAAAAAPSSLPLLPGLRVWVAEDDPAVREAVRLRFAAWGAAVRSFDNAAMLRRAVSDTEPRLPDLLVTDQRLPDGTGLELAQLVRQARPALPVLVVTGDTSPADVALLRDSGLPVLQKPFTAEELLAAVLALLPRPLRPAGAPSPA